MKIQSLVSILSVIVLYVLFFVSNLLAQDEPKQEKNQIKNQVKNELNTQLQTKEHSNRFVDVNSDGYNDNAPDADGDGIPNGKDADFVRPQDGTGQKNMRGKNNQTKFGGNKYGPGNGTGNNGIGPKDGTGNGSGNGTGNGTGTCDGTGP